MLTVNPLRRALTTNATSTGFTAKTATATDPAPILANGAGLAASLLSGKYNLLDPALAVHQGNNVSRYIQLIPFGTNGADDTFDFRLWGWSKYDVGSGGTSLYIPQLLVQLDVTLGSNTATAIAADTYFADTLAIDAGDETSPLISPEDNTVASCFVHLRGCQYIEFDFDLAGAQEGVSMNTFWRMCDQF